MLFGIMITSMTALRDGQQLNGQLYTQTGTQYAKLSMSQSVLWAVA